MQQKMRFFVIAFVFLSLLTMLIINPLKVTDPTSPKFDPMRFHFSDYLTGAELYQALEVILRPGTSMETVDKILVDSARTKKWKVEPPYAPEYYTYHYKRWYHPIFGLLAMHPDPAKGRYIFINYNDNYELEKFKLE